jgi:hypothetical protein
VAVAIILRLDDDAVRQIDALTDALPDRHACRHQPHVKLATYGDEIDVARLGEALTKAVRTWNRLSISLVGIGIFPGEPSGLWLAPVPIHSLLRWHLAVDEALLDVADRHCFEFGIWAPIISIGETAVPEDAMGTLPSTWNEPIEAMVERIDIIRLEPFETITSHTLPG